jgi:hypothetical protein
MAQDAQLEDRLKATFIYNFVQYTEWPRQSLSSASSFNICIVGDSFQSVMEDTVRGERVNGRSIVVRTLSSAENISECQLIYFRDAADPKTMADILTAADTFPILTVGEAPEFIRKGGIIRFTKTGNRIRFEINPQAAEKRSLSLSSRLLRLADIVRVP